MFRLLREKFGAAAEVAKYKSIDDISEVVGDSGRRLRDSVLEEIIGNLEIGLLEADVALPVAEGLTKSVGDSLRGRRIAKGFDVEEAIELALRTAIKEVLTEHKFSLGDLAKAVPPPFIIMFVGINGTG
ncbi:MAG: signal recognition particle receptor subunit alpha, partial [Thermoplasmata archaeon]|nr:signal recognition particle receptor subunit alpha [Thermoplasmata archaeon]